MNPWPIAPITDKDLNFAVVSYDFTSFTNNEETDLPSLEGAIDTSLLDYAGSIADQTGLIASLFSGLDDIFNVLKEIGSDDLESIFVPLSNAASSGDLILTSYDTLIGDNTGSGGGGGGIPQQCATIDFGGIPVVIETGSNSVPHTIGLQNTSGTPLTVLSTRWSPDLGFTFVVNPDISGSVIQPGDTLQITIIFTPGSVGSYQSTLTIQTDAPDPQPCVNVTGSGFQGTVRPPIPSPRCPTGTVVVKGKHTIHPQCA